MLDGYTRDQLESIGRQYFEKTAFGIGTMLTLPLRAAGFGMGLMGKGVATAAKGLNWASNTRVGKAALSPFGGKVGLGMGAIGAAAAAGAATDVSSSATLGGGGGGV